MKITRRQLNRLISEAQGDVTSMDDVLKIIAGEHVDDLSEILDALLDMVKMAGKGAVSHFKCAMKHTAHIPDSREDALNSIEAYGLCVLAGSGLEDVRAKWTQHAENKRRQIQSDTELQESITRKMKITRRQLKRLVREVMLNEKMACPAGQVYYNYGGNVEGCEDEDIIGTDTGKKDPYEQKNYSDCRAQIIKTKRKPTPAAIKQCIAQKARGK